MNCKFLNKDSMQQFKQPLTEVIGFNYKGIIVSQDESVRNRAVKNAIDFYKSIGISDENEMVGITMVGLESFRGEGSAFNITSRIDKLYQGKGSASKKFQLMVPELKEENVSDFTLEVINEEEMTIKAYQKTGSRKTGEIQFFSLELKDLKEPAELPFLLIEQFDKMDCELFSTFKDWQPSWEKILWRVRSSSDIH